jgi:hypothetical protein
VDQNDVTYPRITRETSVQYHQRSRRSFYVRKLHAQLICVHFMFVLYWRKPNGAKAEQRTLVKLTPVVEQSLKQCSSAQKFKSRYVKVQVEQ